jgi:glucosamine--fructose-6-phosphate aminotransferase (isomerizing)
MSHHRELQQWLGGKGHRFRSQTDTEVIAHLIEHYRASGLAEAVRQASAMLQGSYALACIAEQAPDELVSVRRGSSPLVIAFGQGGDVPRLGYPGAPPRDAGGAGARRRRARAAHPR